MGKVTIVYENNKPKFAIGIDHYQWILAKQKKKRGEWMDKSYHPNLSNLLDELAEFMFKKNTKKLEEIKDLEKAIDKTYHLIELLGPKLNKLKGLTREDERRRVFIQKKV